VALHIALVVDVYRFALHDRLRETIRGHVRSSPRPIDSKETQSGGRQSKQMAISVGHQFVRLLRRRVQAYGMIGIVVLAEWKFAISAVYAGSAGKNQVFAALMTACLQDIQEPDD